MPDCQRKGPFSCKRPSSELHPGPPFSQIVICEINQRKVRVEDVTFHTSLLACGLLEGKNQKNKLEFPCGVLERSPE